MNSKGGELWVYRNGCNIRHGDPAKMISIHHIIPAQQTTYATQNFQFGEGFLENIYEMLFRGHDLGDGSLPFPGFLR